LRSLWGLFLRQDDRRQVSIYDHIRSHVPSNGPGLTEGGEKLPDEAARSGAFAWAPGAMDGVATHHMGSSPNEAQVDTILRLIDRAASHRGGDTRTLERALTTIEPLSIVDPLLERLRASQIPPRDVEIVGRSLATTSNSRNAVKVGIAILGITSSRDSRDLFMTLGRHDEFTLYSAVALSNAEADPDGALWELATLVDGWGRIHLVERLRETTRPEIQAWILRGGFRNSIMDEYLAYIAATTGGLTRALEDEDPDDQLLDAACDIICALIRGGPAEDIDDYADGSRAVQLLIGHLETRASTVHHVLAVDQIERYLADDARWASRDRQDWPPELRDRLRTTCRDIIGRPEWRGLALAGMDSDDPAVFWEAERAARRVGVDTLEVHLSRLELDPFGGSWYTVMEIVDEDRVGRVLELAERSLPLDEIASGPDRALGLGPEFRGHQALGFVVQGLSRFPGQGWPLISAALRSPVVSNRNMAMNVLEAWNPSATPAAMEASIRTAASIEPDDQVRARMVALLRGADR
jgi:hypothetical protein